MPSKGGMRAISQEKSLTKLVPTHYITELYLPDEVKKNIDVSSARQDIKLAIMEYFRNAELWEGYGSTEAGLVTLLSPEDQLKKLGSID